MSVNESPASRPDDLVRSLVEQLATTRNPVAQAGDNDAEEIIFDTELDGFRYLLVRLPRSNPSPVNLSPREQEIVRMVAQGHPNKVIAAVLNISCWTVCTHLRRIFAKLGVGSRAAMVARLLELGSIHLRAQLGREAPMSAGGSSTRTTMATPSDSKVEPRAHRRDPLSRRVG